MVQEWLREEGGGEDGTVSEYTPRRNSIRDGKKKNAIKSKNGLTNKKKKTQGRLNRNMYDAEGIAEK